MTRSAEEVVPEVPETGEITSRRRRSPTLRYSEVVSVRVEPAVHGALKRAADAMGMTLSDATAQRLQKSLLLEDGVDPVMRGFGAFRFGEPTLDLMGRISEGLGVDGGKANSASLTLLAKRAYEDGWRRAHEVRRFARPGPAPRACLFCSGTFTPGEGRRLDAKFCCDEHRVRFNSRKRTRGGDGSAARA